MDFPEPSFLPFHDSGFVAARNILQNPGHLWPLILTIQLVKVCNHSYVGERKGCLLYKFYLFPGKYLTRFFCQGRSQPFFPFKPL